MLETMTTLIDKYGFTGCFMIGVTVATIYVLKRLVGKDGIVTKESKVRTQFIGTLNASNDTMMDTQRAIVKTQSDLARTSKGTQHILKEREETIDELLSLHKSQDSGFSTQRLHRAGLHTCQILEAICNQLEIVDQTKGSIEAIRNELKHTT